MDRLEGLEGLAGLAQEGPAGEAGKRHRMSAVVLAEPAGRRPEASSRVATRASSAVPSCNQ